MHRSCKIYVDKICILIYNVADLPDIDLIYYVLPASQYMAHVTQYDQLDVELRTHNEEEVALYKVITLSLIIPPGQEYKVSLINSMYEGYKTKCL